MKTTLIFVIALLSLTNCNSKQEFNLPVSFVGMVDKTPAEIRSMYGAPIKSEKIEGIKDGEVYTVNKVAELKVEYIKGKAKYFMFNFPVEEIIRNPEEALQRCALKLKVSEATEDIHGFSWHQNSGEKLNSIVRINKLPDGQFTNCEAHFFDE